MQSLPWVILIEDLCKPTEARRTIANVHQIKAGPSWMDSIVSFLKEDFLPEDKSKLDKVRRKARSEERRVGKEC